MVDPHAISAFLMVRHADRIDAVAGAAHPFIEQCRTQITYWLAKALKPALVLNCGASPGTLWLCVIYMLPVLLNLQVNGPV